MILTDTSPLVALFNPKDKAHKKCRSILKKINNSLITTIPVLTEVFHLLSPGSYEANNLREFISRKGLYLWFMNDSDIERVCELMEKYDDHPMDLADASIVTAAEKLKIKKIFTLDENDFHSYRIRIGYRYYSFDILA